MAPLPLAGQVALVTGGAGGLGLAIAGELAGRGSRVAILDRDHDLAERAAATIGDAALPVAADVADAAAVDEGVRLVEDRLGPVTTLVNNAGFNAPRLVGMAALTPDEFDAMLDVHLRGTFLVSRAVVPGMTDRRYGRIINQASVVDLMGFPFRAAYAAAKAGIVALTRTLAVETARSGVTVNAIAPGYILTEALQERLARGLLDHDLFAERTPVGRWGRPAEVARVAAFLADPASAFITAAIIPVDGGYSARGDPGEDIGTRAERRSA